MRLFPLGDKNFVTQFFLFSGTVLIDETLYTSGAIPAKGSSLTVVGTNLFILLILFNWFIF